MQRLPGAIFQQVNAQHLTAKVSKGSLCTVTALPWPTRSPDLSSTEHICDHSERCFGHFASLNKLDAKLQQIWN
ncbi:transposable element Tcb2 transposase [Trichonephila clavipes]|nr:transposable element Tcb2 transposase [Trichonephila clavipes]